MTWVVLPCKDFLRAKTRLSGTLAPHERRRLMQAMLEDVLEAVTTHASIEATVLVSDDPTASLLADKYGAAYLAEGEACGGLNEAVRLGCEFALMKGASDILVLHGDLPAISAAEISSIVDAGSAGLNRVCLAPDVGETGTNGMWFSAREFPAFRYGQDSLRQHRELWAALDREVQLIHCPGIALDVDEAGDLFALMRLLRESPELAGHTRQALLEGGLSERLQLMSRDMALPVDQAVLGQESGG